MTGVAGEPEETGETRASWFPMIVIVLAQLQMVINILALPVSLGPIAHDLHAPTTVTATALLVYSAVIASFVMLGAKLGKRFGERRLFQITIGLHGGAMVLMATSTNVPMMYAAQVLAGLTAAVAVPALVVLIAAHYRGRQQATALGILAGLVAVGSAFTFVVAGLFATFLSWRVTWWMLVVVCVVVLVLSLRLKPIPAQPHVSIDLVGVVLSATAVTLLLFGLNRIQAWGLLAAGPDAPFAVLGLSPAPLLLVAGFVVGQGFFVWSRQRVARGRQPLLAMEVLDSREERSAVVAFVVASSISLSVGFLIPLYVQIVQERSPLASAVAVLPYSIAVTLSGVLSVRLYERWSARRMGVWSFALMTAGLVAVAAVLGREHSTWPVVAGLLVVGVGEGVLLTLLFNVLVSASPKSLAGDVGALRGVVNNVSNGLGAALSSVVAVGLLGIFLATAYSRADLPDELRVEAVHGEVDFVTNTDLRHALVAASATTAQVSAAEQANDEARIRALRGSFLIIAAISLLAMLPALGLPRYDPAEIES